MAAGLNNNLAATADGGQGQAGCIWQPPPSFFFFKLNCNVAVKVDGFRRGCGAMIRDNTTAFTAVISLGRAKERSVIMTEAITDLEGLRLATDMGIQRVEVEIDLQVLISYLSSSSEFPISFIGSIVLDIKLLASSFISISLCICS